MKPAQDYKPRTPSQVKEFTGTHMLFIMLGFFGVIISVNFTMAFLASGSWTGLVVKNSYVASQNFNKTLLQAQKQQNLGWTSKISEEDGFITFALTDGSGEPIKNVNVIAYIGRPTHEQEDRQIILENNRGNFFKSSSKLASGYWSIKIIVNKNNTLVYRLDDKLYIQEEK